MVRHVELGAIDHVNVADRHVETMGLARNLCELAKAATAIRRSRKQEQQLQRSQTRRINANVTAAMRQWTCALHFARLPLLLRLAGGGNFWPCPPGAATGVSVLRTAAVLALALAVALAVAATIG